LGTIQALFGRNIRMTLDIPVDLYQYVYIINLSDAQCISMASCRNFHCQWRSLTGQATVELNVVQQDGVYVE